MAKAQTIEKFPSAPAGKSGWPWEGIPTGHSYSSSHWPKISVVTPNFNNAQFLEETIRSVLLQGYPNLEYLVIDGGSTDGSVEILKKYAPFISYWVSEPDKGQGAAIQKGWDRATGDVLAWLNSDDIYRPDALKFVGHWFATHPDQSWLGGQSEHFGDREAKMITRVPALYRWVIRFTKWGEYHFPQPSVFIRSGPIREVGGLDPQFHLSMDFDLYLRLRFRGYEPEPVPVLLSGYRLHSSSKTVALESKFYGENIRVVTKLLPLMPLGLKLLVILLRKLASDQHAFFSKERKGLQMFACLPRHPLLLVSRMYWGRWKQLFTACFKKHK